MHLLIDYVIMKFEVWYYIYPPMWYDIIYLSSWRDAFMVIWPLIPGTMHKPIVCQIQSVNWVLDALGMPTHPWLVQSNTIGVILLPVWFGGVWGYKIGMRVFRSICTRNLHWHQMASILHRWVWRIVWLLMLMHNIWMWYSLVHWSP